MFSMDLLSNHAGELIPATLYSAAESISIQYSNSTII